MGIEDLLVVLATFLLLKTHRVPAPVIVICSLLLGWLL